MSGIPRKGALPLAGRYCFGLSKAAGELGRLPRVQAALYHPPQHGRVFFSPFSLSRNFRTKAPERTQLSRVSKLRILFHSLVCQAAFPSACAKRRIQAHLVRLHPPKQVLCCGAMDPSSEKDGSAARGSGPLVPGPQTAGEPGEDIAAPPGPVGQGVQSNPTPPVQRASDQSVERGPRPVATPGFVPPPAGAGRGLGPVPAGGLPPRPPPPAGRPYRGYRGSSPAPSTRWMVPMAPEHPPPVYCPGPFPFPTPLESGALPVYNPTARRWAERAGYAEVEGYRARLLPGYSPQNPWERGYRPRTASSAETGAGVGRSAPRDAALYAGRGQAPEMRGRGYPTRSMGRGYPAARAHAPNMMGRGQQAPGPRAQDMMGGAPQLAAGYRGGEGWIPPQHPRRQFVARRAFAGHDSNTNGPRPITPRDAAAQFASGLPQLSLDIPSSASTLVATHTGRSSPIIEEEEPEGTSARPEVHPKTPSPAPSSLASCDMVISAAPSPSPSGSYPTRMPTVTEENDSGLSSDIPMAGRTHAVGPTTDTVGTTSTVSHRDGNNISAAPSHYDYPKHGTLSAAQSTVDSTGAISATSAAFTSRAAVGSSTHAAVNQQTPHIRQQDDYDLHEDPLGHLRMRARARVERRMHERFDQDVGLAEATADLTHIVPPNDIERLTSWPEGIERPILVPQSVLAQHPTSSDQHVAGSQLAAPGSPETATIDPSWHGTFQIDPSKDAEVLGLDPAGLAAERASMYSSPRPANPSASYGERSDFRMIMHGQLSEYMAVRAERQRAKAAEEQRDKERALADAMMQADAIKQAKADADAAAAAAKLAKAETAAAAKKAKADAAAAAKQSKIDAAAAAKQAKAEAKQAKAEAAAAAKREKEAARKRKKAGAAGVLED